MQTKSLEKNIINRGQASPPKQLNYSGILHHVSCTFQNVPLADVPGPGRCLSLRPEASWDEELSLRMRSPLDVDLWTQLHIIHTISYHIIHKISHKQRTLDCHYDSYGTPSPFWAIMAHIVNNKRPPGASFGSLPKRSIPKPDPRGKGESLGNDMLQ